MFGNQTPGKPRQFNKLGDTRIGWASIDDEGFNSENVGSAVHFNKEAGYGEGYTGSDAQPVKVARLNSSVISKFPPKGEIRKVTAKSIPESLPGNTAVRGLNPIDQFEEDEEDQSDGQRCNKAKCCYYFGVAKEWITSIPMRVKDFFSGLDAGDKLRNLLRSLGDLFEKLFNWIKLNWTLALLFITFIGLAIFVLLFGIQDNANGPKEEKVEKEVKIVPQTSTECVNICKKQYDQMVKEIIGGCAGVQKPCPNTSDELVKNFINNITETMNKIKAVETKNDEILKLLGDNSRNTKKLVELYEKGIEAAKQQNNKKDDGEATKPVIDLEVQRQVVDQLKALSDAIDQLQDTTTTTINKTMTEAIAAAIPKERPVVSEPIGVTCGNCKSGVVDEPSTSDRQKSNANHEVPYNGIEIGGEYKQNLLARDMGSKVLLINGKVLTKKDSANVSLFDIQTTEGRSFNLKPQSTNNGRVATIEVELGCGSYCDAYEGDSPSEQRSKWPGLRPLKFVVTNLNYGGTNRNVLAQSPRTFRVYDTTGTRGTVTDMFAVQDSRLLFAGEYDPKGSDKQSFDSMYNGAALTRGVESVLIVFDVPEGQKQIRLYTLGLYGDTFELVGADNETETQ